VTANLLILAQSAPPLPDTGAAVLRVLGALLLVLALFLAGVWLFKCSARFVGQPPRAGKLRLLEAKALGHRVALHVVGYDRQRFLVASSPTGVTLISALPDAAADETAAGAPAGFAAALQNVLARRP